MIPTRDTCPIDVQSHFYARLFPNHPECLSHWLAHKEDMRVVCQTESLAFVPDEALAAYCISRDRLTQNLFEKMQGITPHAFRKKMGLFLSQIEWSLDVGVKDLPTLSSLEQECPQDF